MFRNKALYSEKTINFVVRNSTISMKNNIKGIGVALVTPFDKNEAVDFEALDHLVDHVTKGGVDYLVVLGTTAETPTLTASEKNAVTARVLERNAGKLPVVLGVGGNCTANIVDQLKASDLSGVDAILSVTPYYNKPSQEGLFQHYKAVAKASPVPVILYNVPSRTGVNMTAETTLRIAREVKNVLGVKEACGNVTQMSKIIKERPEGFLVISGDDCMTLPLVSLGGDGVISVMANLCPANMSSMYGKALRGDVKDAADEYNRMSDLLQALFDEGNPAGIKAALAAKGMIKNVLRLPLVACSAGLQGRIKDIIETEKL